MQRKFINLIANKSKLTVSVVSFFLLNPVVASADSIVSTFSYANLSGSAPEYSPLKKSEIAFSAGYIRGIGKNLSILLGIHTTASSNLTGFYGGMTYDYEPHLRSDETKTEANKPSYQLRVYENWNYRGTIAFGKWVFSDQILTSNGKTKVPVRAEDLICINLTGSVSRIFWDSYSIHLEINQLSTLSGSFNASATGVGLGFGYWLD